MKLVKKMCKRKKYSSLYIITKKITWYNNIEIKL